MHPNGKKTSETPDKPRVPLSALRDAARRNGIENYSIDPVADPEELERFVATHLIETNEHDIPVAFHWCGPVDADYLKHGDTESTPEQLREYHGDGNIPNEVAMQLVGQPLKSDPFKVSYRGEVFVVACLWQYKLQDEPVLLGEPVMDFDHPQMQEYRVMLVHERFVDLEG